MSWDVVRMSSGDVHVIPVADQREHEELRQCWCRPRLEQTAWHMLVAHNSLDGREYFEPDHDEDDAVERPS